MVEHINLLFNNAGIGGGGEFVNGDRADWERTLVCAGMVFTLDAARSDLLVASEEGHVINTASINGLWASIGPNASYTFTRG